MRFSDIISIIVLFVMLFTLMMFTQLNAKIQRITDTITEGKEIVSLANNVVSSIKNNKNVNTYLLIHTHEYGITPYIFQSKEPLVGHWDADTDATEEELERIVELGKKLGATIEFDKPEYVDIESLDISNIPQI